jgi:hypothetical protein
MAKFEIKFKHTVEESYRAVIEAETMDEALAVFDDEPFDHLENDEPYNTQGIEIEIISKKEIN